VEAKASNYPTVKCEETLEGLTDSEGHEYSTMRFIEVFGYMSINGSNHFTERVYIVNMPETQHKFVFGERVTNEIRDLRRHGVFPSVHMIQLRPQKEGTVGS
jgi:hypothetical protein